MKRHRDTIQFRGQAWEIQQVKQVILPFGFVIGIHPAKPRHIARYCQTAAKMRVVDYVLADDVEVAR
jgi:hypothetical protein